ncbi:unnamed protein product, partial [Mesorhabditis belari]|uniref:Uncharacterized protein n=1 Tax=Mesorhabditis belari TaxID=2138241 RepID=A0AAF3ELW1_9BILA
MQFKALTLFVLVLLIGLAVTAPAAVPQDCHNPCNWIEGICHCPCVPDGCWETGCQVFYTVEKALLNPCIPPV